MMLKDRNGLCDSQSTLSGPDLKKSAASCKHVTLSIMNKSKQAMRQSSSSHMFITFDFRMFGRDTSSVSFSSSLLYKHLC